MRSLLLAPYYRRRAPDAVKTVVFPFFFHDRRTDATSLEVTESLTVLWPAYRRTERRSPDGALRERYRRFLIFSDRLDETGLRTFRILGVAITEQTR